MKVLFFDQQNDLSIAPSSVKKVVKTFLLEKEIETDEVSIYFVTSSAISVIHKDFFQDPTPTDCISFPMDQNEENGYRILGEIFVCPKAALDYLGPGSSEKDAYMETTLYLVHGLLHLLGFDDQNAKDKKIMRSEEKKMMSLLSQKNALLTPQKRKKNSIRTPV